MRALPDINVLIALLDPDHVFHVRAHAFFARDRLHSPRAIADVYLLALAVKHKGTLATFGQSIPLSAVPGAGVANLSGL